MALTEPVLIVLEGPPVAPVRDERTPKPIDAERLDKKIENPQAKGLLNRRRAVIGGENDTVDVVIMTAERKKALENIRAGEVKTKKEKICFTAPQIKR